MKAPDEGDAARVGRPPEASAFSLLCWLAAQAWVACAVFGFLFLATVAVTATGRIAACELLAAGFCPVFLTRAWVDRSRRRMLPGLACGAVAIALAAVVWVRAPSKVPDGASKVSSVYGGDGACFRRLHPGNLLPEVDQLMVCYTVMSVVDRLFTMRQATELKGWTRQLYAEFAEDPDFARLPSALPVMYDEVLGWSPSTGHAFVYIPPGLNRTKPAPVLVFFHGSGGNFKAYLWLWSKIADQLGLVVVAPSYGMGNWRLPETVMAYEEALRDAGALVPVDRANIHVAGLSNGGLAVSQLACARGLQLRSVVFLSPVFDAEQLGSLDLAAQCRRKPMLVLTGDEDDRISLGYVERSVGFIVAAGAAPKLEVVSQANHFMFFSHRTRVASVLVDWFRQHGVVVR